jgi:lysophospholipase L1-like esterase
MLSVILLFRKPALTLIFTLFVVAGFDAFSQATPLKIMPLGNSITQGSHIFPSYRYELWKMLIDAGVNFEFVGSQNLNWHFDTKAEAPSPRVNETYNGKTFSNIHEGHWGWKVDEVLNGKDGQRNKQTLSHWVRRHKPDIVLLHLGTNDLFYSQTPQSTIEELRMVVAEIRKESPGVTIFMAQLIPAYLDNTLDNPTNQRITQYNQLMVDLAASLNTAQSPVILVDQNSGYNATINYNSEPGKGDTYDGLHPNFLGELKMAERWFEAFMNEIIVPLPVELHSFKGMASTTGVRLSWMTASEQDNHYFEVQRGETTASFKAIGRVKGVGTTSLSQNYTFEDKDARKGVNYYRLRQVDFDGTESYSAVVAVNLAKADREDMRVYPTHTQGNNPVTLQMLALKPQEKFSIGIYTLDGKLIKEFDAEADGQGNFIQLINPAELRDGSMYMVRATLPGRVLLRHLLVDR